LNDLGYETHAVSTHLVSGEFGVADPFDTVEKRYAKSNNLMYMNDPVTEKMIDYANRQGWDTKLDKYSTFLNHFLQNPSHRPLFNAGKHIYNKFKKSQGYWSDDGAADALSVARQKIESSSSPFFLFVNFVETHAPYRPPRNYIKQFLPDDVTLREIQEALDYSSDEVSLGRDEISDRQRDILLGLYNAELRYLDDVIGEFYQFLESENIADETVFLIVSDHGDLFGKDGLWGHQAQVYNDVCHVPLIIKYPWDTKKEETDIVELRQLCPHILNVAEGDEQEIRPNCRALVEYYGLDTQLWYKPSERYSNIDSDRWESYQCAFIDKDYKLIYTVNQSSELYDMRSDFGEEYNIAEKEPEIVDEYINQINSVIGSPEENHHSYRDSDNTKDTERMNDSVKDRLSQLGYVE